MRVVILATILALALAGTTEEWKQRTIYQLLTDRFARSDGDTSPCTNLHDYCGGDFKGIQDNLDYIANMGFDAIWISPVVTNTPGGYHGYWAKDWFTINSNFGTEQDLKNLVNACHEKGIWVMVDVVANHAGPVGTDFSQITTFPNSADYHPECSITQQDWNTLNMQAIQNCWLSGLPDLKQENNDVANTLTTWIKQLVTTYGFDGLRIDTVPEVPKWFWTEFAAAAGVYQVGEVFNGDITYVSGYQQPTGPLTATLGYPLFFQIRNMFMSGQSIEQQARWYAGQATQFGDQAALGNFIDNQDNSRFLQDNGYNLKTFQNALAWSLTYPGIPIVYYGDEQGYAGGNDPNNREVLWTNLSNTESEMYTWVTKVVKYRKEQELWNQDYVERYADPNFYCYSRGKAFMCFTNTSSTKTYNVTYHPYNVGDRICNIFWTTDCVTVGTQGVPVTLLNGEVKLYRLVSTTE